MPRLIVLARNSSVRQVNIASPVTTIGRAAYAQVRINSDRVSRHHAVIQWDGDRFVLTDMGSRNGTFVNYGKVTNHALTNGDAISIGDCQLRFLYSSSLLLPGEALRLLTMPDELPSIDSSIRLRRSSGRDDRRAFLR